EEMRRLIALTDQTFVQLAENRQIAPDVPVEQAALLFIALMQGLAGLHVANEPHLPVASSLYGTLIPAAMTLLRSAWAAPPSEN
ncbi:MAG: hypothetical protein K8I30_21420, partial [Anaerolineae bacterium]|nr:hypothetical protein [Anaerolineae bacterium]